MKRLCKTTRMRAVANGGHSSGINALKDLGESSTLCDGEWTELAAGAREPRELS
jgi:hypothetical protein